MSPSKVVTCHAGDTFGDALEKIVSHKVHTLYIVDKEGRPESVLTLTDILALVSDLCGKDNGKGNNFFSRRSS